VALRSFERLVYRGSCRRLLAVAAILDGGSRSEARKIGSVGLQTVRDWVLRFNAEGPTGLIDRKAPGKRPKLDASQQSALAEIVEIGPIPAVHGVVRWRRKDLVQWVWEEFGVTIDESTMSRLLKKLGFRRISARAQTILLKRERIKRQTIEHRRLCHRKDAA
jgi:transposase